MALRKFRSDELFMSNQEAWQVLVFFFGGNAGSVPGWLTDNDRSFAQALLVEAIDKSYFRECTRPLYLTDMAVAPGRQRQGIGRFCVEEMKRIAREWPADAIRLDAYDAEAGAGGFYRKCGFQEVGRVTYRKTPLIYFEGLL